MRKGAFNVSILQSLWETIERFAKDGGKRVNVSQLFGNMAKKLCEKPEPLPICPRRRVTMYDKSDAYKREFPHVRTTLYVDAFLWQKLFSIYEEVAKDQFGKEMKVDSNTLVTTVFYYICRENGLAVDQNYFDDEYFFARYTYNDNKTIESLQQLARLLGKSPTTREWREHRHRVGGPSESYIIKRFKSFNRAKELACLSTNELKKSE